MSLVASSSSIAVGTAPVRRALPAAATTTKSHGLATMGALRRLTATKSLTMATYSRRRRRDGSSRGAVVVPRASDVDGGGGSDGVPTAIAASAYYEKTWSNPTGAVLTPLVDGTVFAAERPFIWNSIDVGGKSAVVRLSDGSLWVHSPVDLDEPLKRELSKLGPVKHVVSPNYEHVKWAAQWKAAYPDATLYGCPGIKNKYPDIPWDEEVGINDGAPEAWLGEIDVAFFDCETTPIVGGPFFNEVLFHHAPSGCVMVTDLFWNYPADADEVGWEGGDVPLGTKAWKFGMDKVYLPFYRRFMVTRPDVFRAATARVLAWDFRAVLPCHGRYVDQGAREILREHLVL